MLLLANRSVIKIGGEDARSFLQGLITNDINKLSRDAALYAAMLTPQGKYLFDFMMYDDGEAVLLDCEAARKDELLKRLNMYKLRAKVQIEDLPNHFVYSANEGFVDPRHAGLGKRIIAEGKNKSGDFAEYQRKRISLGVPDSADFIPDKSFILQYRFEELNGVDFKKGCYVGQEVTARTKHRGTIRKSLYIVEGQGDLPQFGNEILDDGKVVGVMLGSERDAGLALCEIEAVEKNNKIESLIIRKP